MPYGMCLALRRSACFFPSFTKNLPTLDRDGCHRSSSSDIYPGCLAAALSKVMMNLARGLAPMVLLRHVPISPFTTTLHVASAGDWVERLLVTARFSPSLYVLAGNSLHKKCELTHVRISLAKKRVFVFWHYSVALSCKLAMLRDHCFRFLYF